MDPSHSELAQIAAAASPLQALLDFIGMDEPVKAALWDALGGVSKVREIVFVPSEDWDDAVKDALVITTAAVTASEGVLGQPAQTRKLKPIEKAQVGMLRRYARLLCGLTGDEAGGGLSQVQGTSQATAGNAAAVMAKSAHKRTFKLSSVVDQGDDQEVEALPAGDFREAVKKFRVSNDGLSPTADEEATPDQLQGISVKLEQDVVPYADFGVLRPFGQRLERTLKFHARCWDPVKGVFVAKELPGPPSIDEWLRSWKVYSFIMVALRAVTRARLERYKDKIVTLNAKYGQLRGGSWWLIALADQRMRSERMEKLRRELEIEDVEGRIAGEGGFDRNRPWDAVFLAAAQDDDFWREEVAEAALLYISRVKDQGELMDPGHHVTAVGESRPGPSRPASPEGERHGWSKSKARREREKRSARDLKSLKEQHKQGVNKGGHEEKGAGKSEKGKGKGKGKHRIQVCFAWNRDAGGCPTPCPNGRAHVCEFCGASEHKGSECNKAW